MKDGWFEIYYNNGIKFTYHKFFPIPNTQGIVFEYAIIEYENVWIY